MRAPPATAASATAVAMPIAAAATGPAGDGRLASTRPTLLNDVGEAARIDSRLTLFRPADDPAGSGSGRLANGGWPAGAAVEHPIHRGLLAAGRTAGRTAARTATAAAATPSTRPADGGADIATAAVRLLPEQSADPRRFAVVAVPHALLRLNPIDRPGDRDNGSDLLEGEEVWLLDRTVVPAAGRTGDGPGAGGPRAGRRRAVTTSPTAAAASAPATAAAGTTFCWLVHSSDGYLGWVDEPALRFVDAAEFGRRLRAHTSPTAEAAVAKAVAHAKPLAGTRYVWGGKTADGIDCSGLTQTSYAAAGLRLPRDADMQSAAGRLVATRWFRDGLLPGDLLFFLSARRGHVSHVGMYLGDGKFIEAAGKDVHVSSLNPADPAYSPRAESTFGWARRVVE